MKKCTCVSDILLVRNVVCLLYLVDDIVCSKYKNDVGNKVAMLSETEFMNIMNDCTNIANCNHTYLRTAVLVKTDLTKGELQ